MNEERYRRLIGPIEAALRENGGTPRGVLWPNEVDLVTRYDVVFDMVRGRGDFSLLDVGCGPGLVLDYLEARGWLGRVDYHGVDVSAPMIERARADWPDRLFERRDLLTEPLPERSVDYAMVAGVFTARFGLSHQEMEHFATALLRAAWPSVRTALSFNVMSTHVDWQRDDLFHWPMDAAVAFCKAFLSRHVVVRADYGLYEYTVQVYREPVAGSLPVPSRWLGGAR
ncbi:MAG TPA: class I SAM-dependent methyltransferase [Azospirillum sp.]|nr:class I SAM-dependent methyltransferase [Azospirillum sp.]